MTFSKITFRMQYRYWYRRDFFTYFLAIFDTNTFVSRSTN